MTTIGILGAGQLARMIALAGIPLGFHFKFFDPNPHSPVKNLGELINAEFTDLNAAEIFADSVDIITYEFENVPVELVNALQKRKTVYPGSLPLEKSQDRLTEKTFFAALCIPTAPFADITSFDTLSSLIKEWQGGIIKTRRMGYDGKGQFVIKTADQLINIREQIQNVPCILEGFVNFKRELSIIAVRSVKGETAFYPLVQNIHKNGILSKTIAPAADIDRTIQQHAESIAGKTLEALNYVGVLAIELFDTENGLVVNEMAPRVHNSGHWSIEGAVTGQFENHVRAITGLPLGDCSSIGNSIMLNCIGSMPNASDILKTPNTHYHSYDKDPRSGRKVGHVTIANLKTAPGNEPDFIALEEIIRHSPH